MSLSPQAVVNIAVQAAEDKKAEDITVLDIREVSIIADFFLICTGRSSKMCIRDRYMPYPR